MQKKPVIVITKYLSILLILMLLIVEFINSPGLFTGLVTVLFLLYLVVDYWAVTFSAHNNSNKLSDLNKKVKMLEEELESLHEVSKIITSTFDVKVIIEYIYNVLKKVTGCEWCHAYFIDKKSKMPVINYEHGNKNFADTGNLNYTEYVHSLAESNFSEETKIEILSDKSLGKIVAISLNVSEDTTGVIFIGNPMEGTFSASNFNFLKSIACYAAIGIRNAEMFNNIYSQKEEIEALYEQSAANNEELNSYIKELAETKEELNKKNEELTRLFDEMQLGYLQTVMSLANSIEAKDPYTRGHCQRVMEISCELGRALKLSDKEIEDLRYASILHDIGKIGISASILNKEGKLTEEEFEEIKKHPVIAYNILKDVEFIKSGLNGILQHHERYDGKGYPNGIKGKEICIFARIMCVADAFDAMTSDRPYRKGMSMENALKEIDRCKGTQFDPEIADLLISMASSGNNIGEVV
ncbi:MAG: HD domain-containing protein [Clostridium sp.]|nr:HD domain-containing protein [Clostridium sp.]